MNNGNNPFVAELAAQILAGLGGVAGLAAAGPAGQDALADNMAQAVIVQLCSSLAQAGNLPLVRVSWKTKVSQWTLRP
jgi:hypothetical protein